LNNNSVVDTNINAKNSTNLKRASVLIEDDSIDKLLTGDYESINILKEERLKMKNDIKNGFLKQICLQLDVSSIHDNETIELKKNDLK